MFFGKRLYGKVDELCDQAGEPVIFVKTEFRHICCFPLVPLASYVIVASQEKEGGFRDKPLEVSLKSCLVAWIRTGLLAALMLSLYMPLVAAHYNARQWIYLMAFVSLLAVCFMLTALAARPGPGRTQTLMDALGEGERVRVSPPPGSAAAYTAVFTAAMLAVATMVMTGGSGQAPPEATVPPDAVNTLPVAATPVQDPADLWIKDARVLADDGQYAQAGAQARRALESYKRRGLPDKQKAAAQLLILCLSGEGKYCEALTECKALKEGNPDCHDYDQLAADLEAKARR